MCSGSLPDAVGVAQGALLPHHLLLPSERQKEASLRWENNAQIRIEIAHAGREEDAAAAAKDRNCH